MAKRNLIELAAEFSVGEAQQALQILRDGAEQAAKRMDNLRSSVAALEKQDSEGTLAVEQVKQLKTLRKELKDTETVYKSLQSQLSEQRRMQSAISRVMVEGLDKQNGTTINKMIREAEQKLLNFFGKKHEAKVKVILDDGTESFMNVTREKLVYMIQAGKAEMAERKAGATDALNQVEQWSKAMRATTEEQRAAQQREMEFHRMNAEAIRKEQEERRVAASEAKKASEENIASVKRLEEEQSKAREKGVRKDGAHKVTEESAASAAAEYATQQQKTAALEAERLEIKKRIEEASAKIGESGAGQLATEQKLVLTAEERKQKLAEINKEIASIRGVKRTPDIQDPTKFNPTAQTPKEYSENVSEYKRRMSLRDDMEYWANARKELDRITSGTGVKLTDPLGLVGTESLSNAQEQLELIKKTGSVKGTEIPEQYKSMEKYLTKLSGEMGDLVKKAQKAGIDINDFLLGKIGEGAKKAATNLSAIFKKGNSIPESVGKQIETVFSNIQKRILDMKSSIDSGKSPSSLSDIPRLISGRDFGEQLRSIASANTVNVQSSVAPWFQEHAIEELERQLTINGASEKEIKKALREAKKKLESDDITKEYEEYYQEVIKNITERKAAHYKRTDGLKKQFGDIEHLGETIVHGDDASEDRLRSQTLDSVRAKIGVREGRKHNRTLEDGSVITEQVGAIPLAEGEKETRLMELIRQRAELSGKAKDVKEEEREAISDNIKLMAQELSDKEKEIAIQKEAEEQAHKMADAQKNTLEASKQAIENEKKLAEEKAKSAELSDKAAKAQKEYDDYVASAAKPLKDSEEYLRSHDTSVIQNANDMQRYIKVLQEQAPLMSRNAEEYSRYQKAIVELKTHYEEFVQNTRANMKNLSGASDATLNQMRNHFQGIISTVGASSREIKNAQKSIDKIDREQHTRSVSTLLNSGLSSRAGAGEIQKRIQDAQLLQRSAMTTKTEWKQLQKVIDEGTVALEKFNTEQAKTQAKKDVSALQNASNLSDKEISNAIKRLQDYAAAAKLSADERKNLNEAIARGNAELERKQGGDNIVRMSEQYKMLAGGVNGLGNATDEVLRKQQAFWLQQTMLAKEGSSQQENYIQKFREMTAEIERRQQLQRKTTLTSQLGGENTQDLLTGRVEGTEQQIRAAIELTTMLNKNVSVTSEEYKNNCTLIAQGNQLLGEQRRTQEEYARQLEKTRLQSDALNAESDLTSATSKQLSILKQIYMERLQTNTSNQEARASLIAINQEEQRRLELAKQISAEAAKISEQKVSEILSNPLSSTADQVKQATTQAEEQMKGLYASGQTEEASRLATQIENARNAQRQFNEETQRWVMADKLKQVGSLSKSALAEQEKFWRTQMEGVRRGTKEWDSYSKNLMTVLSEQKAMTDKEVLAPNGFLDQINNGTLKTIDGMRNAKQAVEEFRAKFAEVGDTKQMQELDLAIAQVTHDLNVAEKKLMSLDEVSKKLTDKSNARSYEEKYNKSSEKERIKENMVEPEYVDDFSQPEIERMNKSLREAYSYYEAIGDSQGIERTQKAMAMLASETERTKQSAASLAAGEERIGKAIDNPRAEKSLKILQAAYSKLKQEIDNADDSQEAYMKNSEKLKEINGQIQNITKSIEKQKSWWEKTKSALVSHWGVYLNLETVISQVQSMLSGNIDLSDSMANVQKVTSMTNDELTEMVNKLNELDTRTSQAELMNLAEQGGKLGIYNRGGIQSMTDFVEMANQITSTLGEDIGGAEAVDALVKVNDLVNKGTGMSLYEGLSRIGSGVLSVGNNSAAAYADVVNFVNQVGAVGSVSGISMPQLIALGGTFSSLGARIDQSATSINKLLVGLQRNAGKVASVTGQSAAELQAMIDSGDTFEALVSVMERVHEMGGNTSQVIYDILDQFGGRKNAQMFTAMALMADNVSRLREEMFYAQQGYEENTLMASEYARVQDNLAGVLERIGNNIKETFMNPDVQEAMRSIAEGIGWIVDRLLGLGRVLAWAFTVLTSNVGKIISVFTLTVACITRLIVAGNKANGVFSLLTSSIVGGCKYLAYSIGLAASKLLGLNSVAGKCKTGLEECGKAGKLAFSGMFLAVSLIIEGLVRFFTKLSEEKKALGEYNKTINAGVTQADAMFASLERSVEPLKNARVEHEKTSKVLGEVSEKYENGKATQEELTRAEESNRVATDKLNEAKGRMTSALNAVNSAYGATIKLSEQDIQNSVLLEAAHKRVTAAIREEASARLASKMRESVSEKHGDDLSEKEGNLTKSAKEIGENGEGDNLASLARKLIKEYANDILNGKGTTKVYKKQMNHELREAYRKLKIPGKKYAYSDNVKPLMSAAREALDAYVDYYKDLQDTEKTIQDNTVADANVSKKERLSALEDYKKATNASKKKIQAIIDDPKNATFDDMNGSISMLQNYFDTATEIIEKSPSSVKDNDRKALDKVGKQLSLLKSAKNDKMLSEFWGKEGKDLSKRQVQSMVDEYNRIEEWNKKLQDGMSMAETVGVNSDIYKAVQATGTSMQKTQEIFRDRAEAIKNELNRRGLNTSGKFKWKSDGESKNKWKSDTKEQYNAYLKELDDFYTRQRMELEQLRADEQLTEEEFNHRTEKLDKEHYTNRARLRNMFLLDERRDMRTGLLDDSLVNRIFGNGQMSDGQIASWKESFEKTRKLINRLGDAFVDEIALKSGEDRVKAVQILRKAQDELEKAILDGDPFAKVLDEYEEKMDKLHQIFGTADWMAGNEHEPEEYQKRLDMLRGYSAQILSTSEKEFVSQISQTEEFAGRTVGEYQLLYDSLLQLRDDYDEAARKQAKKDLRLMDARVENGQYYKDQLAIYEKALEGMDWGSTEAQNIISMVNILKKRQNTKDENGKEVSYNDRQKARLENAKKEVAREEAVGNTGVTNEINLAKAKLGQARMEVTMAYDVLTARRSYMDANIAETEKELADLREQKASQEQINAKEADLAAMKVMQSEAITEANEKVEESERSLSQAEADLLSARIKNAKEWQEIFSEYVKSMGEAGSSQAESNAFKIAEINARRSLGLYKETMKQRYLILQQNGKYEERYMDEEEYLRMQNRIASENEMKEATAKMLNDYGEKVAQSLTDAFQRMMQLQQEQEKEAEKQNVITSEQESGIQQRMANEQAYTTFYRNELALRLQEAREFYRQLNALSAGSPSVVLGQTSANAMSTQVGTMPGDILNNMQSLGISDGNSTQVTSPIGTMPGDIINNLLSYGISNDQISGLQSQWEQAATFADDYYNSTTENALKSNEEQQKSQSKMTKAMISGMNMYGAAYSAVMNDNLSASQKVSAVVLQTMGNMIISLLTATLSQNTADAGGGLAVAISKAFAQLGPVGGPAAIAGITATIGAAMAAATKKVAKSKKEVAAATGAGSGKLTTEMLTYAEGRYPNEAGFSEGTSYRVDGADGHTYNAQYEGTIKKTGIRKGTHFGIFSEKKPEMVIDGDTTALMHKQYPELEEQIRLLSTVRRLPKIPTLNHEMIRHSMEVIERHRTLGMAGTSRLAMNTYATGNVEQVVKTLTQNRDNAMGDASSDTYQGTSQDAVLSLLTKTISELQTTLAAGIRADVSSKSFAKAKRFEKRNGITGGLLD